jgi:hypothetical protein
MWCLLSLNVIATAIFCQAHYINRSTSFIGCGSNNPISDVGPLFCQDSSKVVGKFVVIHFHCLLHSISICTHQQDSSILLQNSNIFYGCRAMTTQKFCTAFSLLSIPWYKQTPCSHCTSYPLLDLKCNQIVLHHMPYTKCSVLMASLSFYAIYIFKYFNTLLSITWYKFLRFPKHYSHILYYGGDSRLSWTSFF